MISPFCKHCSCQFFLVWLYVMSSLHLFSRFSMKSLTFSFVVTIFDLPLVNWMVTHWFYLVLSRSTNRLTGWRHSFTNTMHIHNNVSDLLERSVKNPQLLHYVRISCHWFYNVNWPFTQFSEHPLPFKSVYIVNFFPAALHLHWGFFFKLYLLLSHECLQKLVFVSSRSIITTGNA